MEVMTQKKPQVTHWTRFFVKVNGRRIAVTREALKTAGLSREASSVSRKAKNNLPNIAPTGSETARAAAWGQSDLMTGVPLECEVSRRVIY